MSARPATPPPNLGGLSDDWQRLKKLRHDDSDDARPEPDSDGSPGGEAREDPPSQRHRPAPGRTRGGRRPPPAAADAVPTTVRFDPEEASEIDKFVLDLRDDAGRRSLDKAEVIRELLRLAQEHAPTRRALLKRVQ